MPCPKCGADAPDGVRYCETCGASLTPDTAPAGGQAAELCRCGSSEFDAQGYCTSCGTRRPAPARAALPRDHVEITLSPAFAAVTDRGTRHANNQDDVTLASVEVGGQIASVLVVCDGVSSAQKADEASAIAAAATRDALLESLRAGTFGPEAVADALLAAHEAVKTIPYRRDDDTLGPPGTTAVAAVALGGALTLGWAGDSRAYWVTPSGARRLTRDHSWVNEMVEAGEMTEEEALHSKQAHAITRCLGPLNGEDALMPSVAIETLPPACRLLVCSDGLWNYADAPEEMAALVQSAPEGADALALCRHLVNFALAQGGRDNITAAVLSLP